MQVEPNEKMKVNLRNLSFENAGEIVQSYADESLTFTTNEHLMECISGTSERFKTGSRFFYNFIIRSTNSDSRNESTFAFWSMEVDLFVYFSATGGKIKLLLMPEVSEDIVVMDFLNPADAQLFWYYTMKNRHRARVI